jgi:hypothetical protein
VIVLRTLRAVVAIAKAHAAVFFPRMFNADHARIVFGGPVSAVLVPRVLAPAIVYDDFVLGRGLVISQARISGLCHSAELRSHSPSLKIRDGL